MPSPVPQVDREFVNNLGAVDEPHRLMPSHGRVEVGGHKTDSLIEFDGLLRAGNEGDVFVAAKHDLPLRPDGSPWSIPSALSPAFATT